MLKSIVVKENGGVFHVSCVALQPKAWPGESIHNDLRQDSSLEIKSFMIKFNEYVCYSYCCYLKNQYNKRLTDPKDHWHVKGISRL